LPIYLSGYGVFPGPPAVVWIAPVITADLLARHASLHSALRTFPCERHYLPGNWMPHVTLTSAATSASRAMEVLTPLWKGALSANLNRLELVSFHPVQVLWTQALGFL
jgi:2'-5' RNA ligase